VSAGCSATAGAGVVSGHLTGASLRAFLQDPAEVAVLREDLDAPGVIGPGLAAFRAGAGQLLIPSDPTIAAILRVSQAGSFRLAGPLEAACMGYPVIPLPGHLPAEMPSERCCDTSGDTRRRTSGH
jgi:hypothetical protein